MSKQRAAGYVALFDHVKQHQTVSTAIVRDTLPLLRGRDEGFAFATAHLTYANDSDSAT